MEQDMKAVSEGAKRKTEVLETCLQQMKACFLDVSFWMSFSCSSVSQSCSSLTIIFLKQYELL